MTFWEGFFIGILFWWLLLWILNKVVANILLDEVKKELNKTKIETEEILLILEKHQNILYCYRKDNNEFVGQGMTVEEISNIFRKKYPKNTGKILKDDGTEFVNIQE